MCLKKLLFLFLSLSCFYTFKANATKLTPEINEKISASKVINLVDLEGFMNLVDEKDNLVLIDSRSKKDRKGGHIEGSISLPDTETTGETLQKVISSKTLPVLFYCNGVKCGRSSVAALIAEKNKYTEIYVYSGGWEEWIANEMPIVK